MASYKALPLQGTSATLTHQLMTLISEVSEQLSVPQPIILPEEECRK